MRLRSTDSLKSRGKALSFTLLHLLSRPQPPSTRTRSFPFSRLLTSLLLHLLHPSFPIHSPHTMSEPVVDILLVGFGAVGVIYAYMLEKVRRPGR